MATQRKEQPGVHLDTNPVQPHYTPTSTTTNVHHYEPPTNDSILQGAVTVPGSQFTTTMTKGTGHNEPWRYNNGTGTDTCTDIQMHMTRQTSHNGFQYNSSNLSDNRRGPTCYRCGEQGHMKIDCKERVYCTIAGQQTMTSEFADDNTTTPQAHQTTTSQQDITPQQHPHH